MNTAPSILKAAASHMQDRAATYDRPQGERSMGATVDAFNAITGHKLTEEQGWLLMILLKAVRSQQGAYRSDSYEDGAAYFALAGEAAALTRTAPHAQTVPSPSPSPRTADSEPAAEIDDESDRIQAIGQNGNGGEHYDAEKLERWKGAPKWAKWWAVDRICGGWYEFEPSWESSGKYWKAYNGLSQPAKSPRNQTSFPTKESRPCAN